MQAGTSAPGGLVDLVVKRPLDAPLSSAFVEWRERGSVLGAVDLSRRFGTDNAFGLRLNAAAEHIDPKVRDARGHRNLLALAGDWRVAKGTLLEAEVETSRRSQPSVPGFSLLGDVLPSVPDPRLNLNNQPWSEPVVFDATTASLRLTQAAERRLAPGRARRGAAPEDRRPAGLRLRLLRSRAGAGRHLLRRPLLPERQLRSLRLPERERAAPQRRARPLAARPVRDRIARPHAGGRRIAEPGAPPVRDAGVQLRRHRQRRRHGDDAGGPDADDAEHEPRRALDRALPARPDRLRPAHRPLARRAVHAPAPHHRQHRRPEPHRLLAVVHDAVRRRQLRLHAGADRLRELGPRRRERRGSRPIEATRTPARPSPPRKAGRWRSASRAAASGSTGTWRHSTSQKPRFDDVGTCFALPGDPPDCTRALAGTQRHRGVEAGGAWRQGGLELRGGAQWLQARAGRHAQPGARRQAADQRSRP